jgi:hypothetical protein
MATVGYDTWVIRHVPSDNVVAKFNTPGGAEIPDTITDHPDVSIEQVSSLDGYIVDQTALSAAEKDALADVYPVDVPHPDYVNTLNLIEKAGRRYGDYWVYRRLQGDTPPEMPDPLENQQSVPARRYWNAGRAGRFRLDGQVRTTELAVR